MKVYINIKRNSNLRLHQPFNKRIGLMKRERTHRTLHHFSFGERFDETMMNVYHYGYQSIILSTHQFIGFLSTNKSAGQTDGRKCHYPQTGRTAGRSDVRPTDKEKRIISTTRKGLPIPLVLSQAFGNRKAKLIRAFSLRSAGTAKNAPMSQRGYTPLDTPVCHAA